SVPLGMVPYFSGAPEAMWGYKGVFPCRYGPDWPTADKAAKEMEAEMAGADMGDMPFDGMRMFWGGFVPVMDKS
ncbi:MAG: DUF1428 domain-containing protein, partial [Paracoccus sp. (in: a-proteobacteria)]